MRCGKWKSGPCLLSLALLMFIAVIIKPSSSYDPQNICASKTSCHECIQMINCAWCFEENFDKQRCFLAVSKQVTDFCNKNSTVNPDNAYWPILNKTLTKERSKKENIIQLSPQRVGLKLRINKKQRIQLNYSQASDYPIDLYYLMDLSHSMKSHKDKLSNLGTILSDTMKNITSDFRLGFGSFIDKVVMPFTIPNANYSMPQSYSYKHVMSLSDDADKFSKEVKDAKLSGNIDHPEGGFDAIMQAIMCKERIGWRDQVRRLIVFSTDAPYHYAGDGKLGGIIEPNDEKCHLNETGFYTKGTELDYPSVSHINKVVTDNLINIIFAVTQSEIKIYEKLSKRIAGSSAVELDNDSSNVVKLVKEQYDKISSSVKLTHNATSDIVITFESNCLNKTGPLMPTDHCDGIKVGNVVSFRIGILVTSCPKSKSDWNQIIKISPIGLNDSLIIDLEMLCDCSCEQKTDSQKCNGHGSYKCGLCECNDNHFGESCECSTDDKGTLQMSKDSSTCNMTATDCSGHGTCICGKCVCEKRQNPTEKIYGKFCECDNFSCDRPNGILCSGPNKGSCECGQCVCQAGWTGNACACPTSTDSCIAPGTKEICSGHGECECGKCKCTDDTSYYGHYCENCPTCPDRCKEFQNCVQCQTFKEGPLKDPELCAKNCTLFNATSVEKFDDKKKHEYSCLFFDEAECRYQFLYSDDNERIQVKALKERDCPPIVFAMRIALSCVGIIVLIGLLTLLMWKWLTHMHDKREFEKFERERLTGNLEENKNPLYHEPTSTFKNPTYGGR